MRLASNSESVQSEFFLIPVKINLSFTVRLLGNISRQEDQEKGGLQRREWRGGAARPASSVFGRFTPSTYSQRGDDLTNQLEMQDKMPSRTSTRY